MRKIKFRQWDEEMKMFCSLNIPEDVRFMYEERAVDQFTGLSDGNETEIYEGDILECQNMALPGYRHRFDVRWRESECAFVQGERGGNLTPDDIELGNWEVIGNIHQNPNLLT